MTVAGLSTALRWWAIVWGSLALTLVGVALGVLTFGVFLAVFLAISLFAILCGIYLGTRYGLQRQWLAAAIAGLLPMPLLLWWSILDVSIFLSDWSYFRSHREAYASRVASLPVGAEPRFVRLSSEQLGSALMGPIERSIVYDESGRVAGPTDDEAAAFRARFYPDAAAVDACVRVQRVRSLGGNFYVIRGECEF